MAVVLPGGARPLSSPVWGGPDEAAARGTVRTSAGPQAARFNWLGEPIPAAPTPTPEPAPVPAAQTPPPVTAISAGGSSTPAPRPWDNGGGAYNDQPYGGGTSVQQEGPGGVPFNWDNVKAAVAAAMGPSLTGTRWGDIAVNAAQALAPGPAGAIAGIAGMGARAAATSAAPYNADINPWADIAFDANGQPVGTISGRPLDQVMEQARAAGTARTGPGNPNAAFDPNSLPGYGGMGRPSGQTGYPTTNPITEAQSRERLGMAPREAPPPSSRFSLTDFLGITSPAAPPAPAQAPAPTAAPESRSYTFNDFFSGQQPASPTPPGAAPIPGEDNPVPQSELGFLPEAPAPAPAPTTITPATPGSTTITGSVSEDNKGGFDPGAWNDAQADKGGTPAESTGTAAGKEGGDAKGSDAGQSTGSAGDKGDAASSGGDVSGSSGYGGDGDSKGGEPMAEGGTIMGGTPGVDSVPIEAQQDEYVLSVPFLEYLNMEMFGQPGTDQIHALFDEAQQEATGEMPNNAEPNGGPAEEGAEGEPGGGGADDGMALQRLTQMLQSMGGSGGGPGMIGGGPPAGGMPPGGMPMGGMGGMPPGGPPGAGGPPPGMGVPPPGPPGGAMPPQPGQPKPQAMMAEGGRVSSSAPPVIIHITAGPSTSGSSNPGATSSSRPRFADGGGVGRETPMVGFADGGMVRDMPGSGGYARGGRTIGAKPPMGGGTRSSGWPPQRTSGSAPPSRTSGSAPPGRTSSSRPPQKGKTSSSHPPKKGGGKMKR